MARIGIIGSGWGERAQAPNFREAGLDVELAGLTCCGRMLISKGFLPEARGQGFGSALLKWAQASAMNAGAAGIDLHVLVTNSRAQMLYRCLGFQDEGEPEGYHQRMAWRSDAQLNTA